jgi:predicted alpha/beta hydrolase
MTLAVAEEALSIRASDGASSEAALFVPDRPRDSVILVTPAMGVAARHYRALSRELARAGFIVVSAELRGIGTSSVRAGRRVDFGYRELVTLDMPAAVSALRERFPSAKIFLLGHSIGGHMSALFASTHPESVAGLILVAAGTSFYKAWPLGQSMRMLGAAALTRSVSKMVGYFPGRYFGFFGTEAKRLMHEWSSLTTRGRFVVTGSDVDFERALAELELPVLALSFEGDVFAPRGAVEHLLGKLKSAEAEHIRMRAADLGAERVDHFRWAKYPSEIVDRITRWVDAA